VIVKILLSIKTFPVN